MAPSSESEDKLFCMEEIPTAHPLVVMDMMKTYTEELSDWNLPNFKESVAHFKDNTFYMCFRKEEFRTVGKEIMEKMVNKPEWFDWIDKTNYSLNKSFLEICKKIIEINPKNLTNRQISSILKAFFELKRRSHMIGQVPVVLEFEFQHYTNYMVNLIKEKIKKNNLNHDPFEIFNIMTTPRRKSIVIKEEIELLKLAQKIKKGTISEDDIENHFKNYCWINYMFVGPAYKKEYFTERLKGLVNGNVNLEQEIRELEEKNPKQDQEKIEKELKLIDDEKRLFQFGRRFLFNKVFRKDALVHGFYSIEKILEEAANRLGLNFNQTRHLKQEELIEALEGKEFDKNELDQRLKLSTFIIKDGKEKILYNEQAKDYVKDIFSEIKEQINELKGMPACKGFASGAIKIINTVKDLEKMEQGNILVSICTNPDLVPAMKKAAAIITDVGGISCHAAIVAREMKKPCIVGTKIATRIIKDGSMIEVDADKSLVHLIH